VDDIEDIYEIELESFKNPWIFDKYVNEFRIPYSQISVAESGGRIVGFSLVWFVNDEVHLNKIAVRYRHRRNRIASSLIDHIIQIAKDAGSRVIYLEVRERNKEARAFYRKLGFTENGIRKKYYPDDNAILIEKMIE